MKIAGVTGLGGLFGVKVSVANFFLCQSIGFDKNNTFQLKFLF